MAISQFPIPAGGIPTGDTAGRPASPVIGDVYYNGETGILEIFDGTIFIPCSAAPLSPTVVSAVDVGTSAAFGSAQATVTLAAVAGGGIQTEFQAIGILGGTSFESAVTSSTTVTLTVGNAGTYSIGGKTSNIFGISVTGATTSVALTTVPEAPTIGTATTSGATTDVTVTWTLNDNGGKNLTAIEVIPYLDGTTAQTATTAATTSSTSATIVNLSGNSAYTFKVKAINDNGDSVESVATASVTVPNLIGVQYLVIAGGGGGGAHNPSYKGGGGGAGGYRSSVTGENSGGGASAEAAFVATISTNYTTTVGGGGTGGQDENSTNGSNSVFSTITSTGGGYGGDSRAGNSGGSGGGGGTNTSTPGNGTANQGFAGGTGKNSPTIKGGGGGGAGGAGVAGTVNGNGGVGVASSITGSSVGRAGGGGGHNFGIGVDGGGSADGNAGTANTGGGGGGYQGPNFAGAGGSGVVIFKYPDSKTITIGAGLTGSTATAGGFSVTTITAGTGNVSWA
jgi:hypothetical protein